MGTTPHAREPPPEAASPKLLDRIATPAATTGRVAAIWKQLGAPNGPCPTRWSDGVSPTISRDVRLKVPELVKPRWAPDHDQIRPRRSTPRTQSADRC
jgi:hypothetical protein